MSTSQHPNDPKTCTQHARGLPNGRLLVIAMAMPLALGACTTTLSVREVPTEPSSLPVSGVPYYLPVKQMTGTLAFEVTGCKADTPTPNPQVNIEYELTATLSERQHPDTREQYVIDYATLDSLSKTTDFQVTLTPQGVLVSLNSGSKDQTANIIKDVATSAFSIAGGNALSAIATLGKLPTQEMKTIPQSASTYFSAGSNLPKFDEAATPIRLSNPCETVDKKLKALEQAQEAFATATKLEAEKSKLNSDVTEAFAQVGRARQSLSLMLDDKTYQPEEIEKAKQTLRQAQINHQRLRTELDALAPSTLTRANQVLASAKAALTFNKTAVWIPTADTATSAFTIDVPESELAKLGNLTFANKMRAEVQTRTLNGDVPKPSAKPKGVTHGLVFRNPVPMVIKVCANACANAEGSKYQLMQAQSYLGVHYLPQLGQHFSLPLVNGPFADNRLMVSFGDSGSPTSVEFKVNAAAGSVAAGTLKDVAGQHAENPEKKLEAEKSALEKKSEILKLENKIACLKLNVPGKDC